MHKMQSAKTAKIKKDCKRLLYVHSLLKLQ